MIIHIQDLHCNYEVQKNIAAMIHLLAKEHNLKLVGEEGAFRAVNIHPIRSFPIPEIREAVSDYFLKQGMLTGAEYYGGTGEYPILLQGIESPGLYKESLQAVRAFFNSESQGYCQDLREMLDALKPGIYHPPLLAVDEACTAYRRGAMDILAYAMRLKAFADQAGVALGRYPQLENYLRLGQKMFGPEVAADPLFQEMDALDRELREGLYTSENQRELDSLVYRLDVIEKILNISATEEDLTEIRAHRDRFSMGRFMEFIRRESGQAQIQVDGELNNLESYLNRAEEFYRLADARSEYFVSNIVRQMDQRRENLAVVVTGGFHTKGMLAEFQKQGIGYLSVKPRLTRLEVANPYFSLLQGKKLPLEKMLAKKPSALALRVWPETPDYKKLVAISYGIPGQALLPSLNIAEQQAVQQWLRAMQSEAAIQPMRAGDVTTAAGFALPAGCEVYSVQLPDGKSLLVLVAKQDGLARTFQTGMVLDNLRDSGDLGFAVFRNWRDLESAVENLRLEREPACC